MGAKVMILALGLCIVGLVMFLHGSSLSNQVMNPENMISGTFLVVLGIFLGLAVFLMLLLHMFQRQSLSY